MAPVFIVDEEYHFAENVASALRFEGREATVFHDATEALEYFVLHSDDLAKDEVKLLVDVSLAPGEDLETFSREATDDFFETGIVLVKTLMERCQGLCRADNTILYTAHFQTPLWRRIEEFCTKHRFSKWQKVPDSSVDDIIALV